MRPFNELTNLTDIKEILKKPEGEYFIAHGGLSYNIQTDQNAIQEMLCNQQNIWLNFYDLILNCHKIHYFFSKEKKFAIVAVEDYDGNFLPYVDTACRFGLDNCAEQVSHMSPSDTTSNKYIVLTEREIYDTK